VTLPPKRTQIPPPDSPITKKSGASADEVAASRQTEGQPAAARADDVPRPPSGERYDQVGTTYMLDASVANTVAPEPARRGLFEAVRRTLQLVVIDLDEDDDPQVIFEKLASVMSMSRNQRKSRL
jgi:hypothetical protein